MSDIVIVDYGAGNIRSLSNALVHLGINPILTSDHSVIASAKKIILPGVGSFPFCVKQLRRLELDVVLKETVKNGTPLLGICVGMQMLFDYSHEHGGAEGLGLIAGEVVHLSTLSTVTATPAQRYPHVEWNQVRFTPEFSKSELFAQPPVDGNYYFVHSYACVPTTNPSMGVTHYGDIAFCSAVVKNNLCGVQFHPEKSGPLGLDLLQKFSMN